MKSEHLYRIDFTTTELRQVPKLHSGFLVTSCLAINDISLSLRLLLMALNSKSKLSANADDAMTEFVFSQLQMIERGLGAKIYEYLNMLGAYHTRCKKANDTIMLPLVKAALDEAESTYRVGDAYELAQWYRNNASSHYLVSPITDLMMKANIAENHVIYLAEQQGNANYLIGEQVLLGRLSQGGKNGEEMADLLKSYGKCVEYTARFALKVHGDLTVELFRKIFRISLRSSYR